VGIESPLGTVVLRGLRHSSRTAVMNKKVCTVTDNSIQIHLLAANQPQREADAPFFRRILFGLIAATITSGAVTVALISQHDLQPHRFEFASAQKLE
jgi:hypothetical protein